MNAADGSWPRCCGLMQSVFSPIFTPSILSRRPTNNSNHSRHRVVSMAADPKAAATATGPADGPGLNSSQPTETEIDTNWDECVESFDSMDLRDDLLRGIYAYGFEKPSAIQQRAVKPVLMGRDVIAQAQSGEKGVSKRGLGCERRKRESGIRGRGGQIRAEI